MGFCFLPTFSLKWQKHPKQNPKTTTKNPPLLLSFSLNPLTTELHLTSLFSSCHIPIFSLLALPVFPACSTTFTSHSVLSLLVSLLLQQATSIHIFKFHRSFTSAVMSGSYCLIHSGLEWYKVNWNRFGLSLCLLSSPCFLVLYPCCNFCLNWIVKQKLFLYDRMV